MQPCAVVRWTRVRRQDGDSIEGEELALTIPGVARDWGEVERVAAVVCTIGSALEERVAALWAARELPLAAMLDSVGSGAVESLAEYVNDQLCQEAVPLALRVTNRISPGYGDWDVRDQRVLFRFCPGDAIGVRLNDACFMTPEKSITFLVGAGPHARVDHYFSQCARCWMAQCAYRRVPPGRTVRRSAP
jgi:cobalamin-dependent methionine synthase I